MKKILCFGDSNTWGLIPGTDSRYPADTRWTGILGERLRGKAEVIEDGVCGRTTVYEDEFRPGRKGLDSIKEALSSHPDVDIVVLMLGTNDCKSFYALSAEQIAEGLRACIEEFRNLKKDIEILLVSPIHLGNDVWKEGYDTEFNENSVYVSRQLEAEYRKLSAEYSTLFLAASDHAVVSHKDEEHMEVEGHRALADAVISVLEPLLD